MPSEPIVNHDHDLSVADAVVTCDALLESVRAHAGDSRVVLTVHERKAIRKLLQVVRDVHDAVT